MFRDGYLYTAGHDGGIIKIYLETFDVSRMFLGENSHTIIDLDVK